MFPYMKKIDLSSNFKQNVPQEPLLSVFTHIACFHVKPKHTNENARFEFL